MHRELGPSGLRIVAVDVSADEPRTRAFYEQFGYTIPVAFDPGQEVAAKRFGVIGTPTNYLLDARGRIVWRHYGYRPGDEVEVRSRIERLLRSLPRVGD